MDLVDAYAHVGTPRYGTASEALATFDRNGVAAGVLVLGPGIPDLEALATARELAGDRVRCMGIPFGDTAERRLEFARRQVELGVSGLRMTYTEVAENPEILELLGDHGLWVYAVYPEADAAVTHRLLEWLEAYPEARVAAPHFLSSSSIDETADDPEALRELLGRPDFHPILSRHGAASDEPYPHEDLRGWTREVADLAGWDQLLWGSEYPVLYWRDETVGTAANWLGDVGLEVGPDARRKVHHDNARRLFFESDSPAGERVTVPDWVAEQYSTRSVPLLQGVDLELPMDAYAPLLSGYLDAAGDEPDLRFGEYLARQLAVRAGTLEGDAGPDGR